ncbi:hypothetical protein CEV32_1693 [Brucella rhizosphaerae]|uniref:Uncharacterized protein n=1 Tax=Brucella rhizosphaerae TaxID=571254 RepID=A0A256F335_9HYPH|nr:hypothetical protein CEV32_1693 [Brucella rhizosphaerae]
MLPPWLDNAKPVALRYGNFTPFNLKRDDYEASTAEQAHARTGE